MHGRHGRNGTLIAAGGVTACVAGAVRGITGFGGAMVMAPPLAIVCSAPKLAVPVVPTDARVVRQLRRCSWQTRHPM